MKRWKSEMLQNYLEKTLHGRNAANSVQIRSWTSEMLQTACKTEGLGHHWGPIPWMGGQRHGTRQHIYIYIYSHPKIDRISGISKNKGQKKRR